MLFLTFATASAMGATCAAGEYQNNDVKLAKDELNFDNHWTKWLQLGLSIAFGLFMLYLILIHIGFWCNNKYGSCMTCSYGIVCIFIFLIAAVACTVAASFSGMISETCNEVSPFLTKYYSSKQYFSTTNFFKDSLFEDPENDKSFYNNSNFESIIQANAIETNIINHNTYTNSHTSANTKATNLLNNQVNKFQELSDSFKGQSIVLLSKVNSQISQETNEQTKQSLLECANLLEQINDLYPQLEIILKDKNQILGELSEGIINSCNSLSSLSPDDFSTQRQTVLDSFQQNRYKLQDNVFSSVVVSSLTNDAADSFCVDGALTFYPLALFSFIFLITFIGTSILYCQRRPGQLSKEEGTDVFITKKAPKDEEFNDNVDNEFSDSSSSYSSVSTTILESSSSSGSLFYAAPKSLRHPGFL